VIQVRRAAFQGQNSQWIGGTDQCGSGGETSGAGVVDQDGNLNQRRGAALTRSLHGLQTPRQSKSKFWPAHCSNETRLNTNECYMSLASVTAAQIPPDGCLGGLYIQGSLNMRYGEVDLPSLILL